MTPSNKESVEPRPLPDPRQGVAEQHMADAPDWERGSRLLLLGYKGEVAQAGGFRKAA